MCCPGSRRGDPLNVQEPCYYLVFGGLCAGLLIWFSVALRNTMAFNQQLNPQTGTIIKSSQTAMVTWYGTHVIIQVQWVEYVHDNTVFRAGIFHEGPFLADGSSVSFYTYRGNPYQAVGERVFEGQLIVLVSILAVMVLFIVIMLLIWVWYSSKLCAAAGRGQFQRATQLNSSSTSVKFGSPVYDQS